MDKLLSEAIAACYPKSDIQKLRCSHVPNSLTYVSYKDYKKVTAAPKPIDKAPTEDAALEELDKFEETWGSKYPLVIRSLGSNCPDG
jgi:putative transposase